jgi:hypothetical protein
VRCEVRGARCEVRGVRCVSTRKKNVALMESEKSTEMQFKRLTDSRTFQRMKLSQLS